jgi:hypothetical protein
MAERRREPAERDDILSLMMSARYEDGSGQSARFHFGGREFLHPFRFGLVTDAVCFAPEGVMAPSSR